MMRLLGFLSGLLLVTALGFVALEHPPTWLSGGEDAGGTIRDESAMAAPPESDQQPVMPPAPVETLPPVDDPAPAPAAAVAAGAGEDSGDDHAAIAATAATAATAADDAGESARQWHAFWQPFHSEISAEGFRRRLEGVTGLDYRVVSPRPGEYQVAFAYQDEAERQQNLAAIEEATGLVLRSRVL
ncbi:hypothetical protein [Lentisalinibacter sediminis]|uniref:hypothetical protein n=1 Tax=Lentisalinibacter sediminis TaxID=2992237 RepID=UPI003863EED6